MNNYVEMSQLARHLEHRLNGAFCIIKNAEGQILITHRKNGQLDLPGGGISMATETGRTAVKREVHEETRLYVKEPILRAQLVQLMAYSSQFQENGKQLFLGTLYLYESNEFVGVPTPDNVENTKIEWMNKETILKKIKKFSMGMARVLLFYFEANDKGISVIEGRLQGVKTYKDISV